MNSKKTLLSLKGIKLFAGDFLANLNETNTDMVQFTKDGTGNGLSNIKDTFCKLIMSVLHQSMNILQPSRLVSQVHMIAGQNVKKKYLMC